MLFLFCFYVFRHNSFSFHSKFDLVQVTLGITFYTLLTYQHLKMKDYDKYRQAKQFIISEKNKTNLSELKSRSNFIDITGLYRNLNTNLEENLSGDSTNDNIRRINESVIA